MRCRNERVTWLPRRKTGRHRIKIFRGPPRQISLALRPLPSGRSREDQRRGLHSQAVKVVVMSLSGAFINRTEVRMRNPFQPAVIDENFQVPIDGCLISDSTILRQYCRISSTLNGLSFCLKTCSMAFFCVVLRLRVRTSFFGSIGYSRHYCKLFRNKLDKGRYSPLLMQTFLH